MQPEPMKQNKDSRICALQVCRVTTSETSTLDGIKLYYQRAKTPSDVILEGLYKSKLQDSVQLQIVLALYDKETARNSGKPNCSQLKTAVKLHVDQMMRTRNLRV